MVAKKTIENYPYVSYSKPIISEQEMVERSKFFYDWMENRRTVREFSNKKFQLRSLKIY